MKPIFRASLSEPSPHWHARNWAHSSLLAFTVASFPGYLPGDHHRLIAAKLEAVERGDIDRLLIFMPPRHGKSELGSIRFPAWYLGRNPTKRVIAASYAARLAERFSRASRNLTRHPAFQATFPDFHLAADRSAVQNWELEQGGGYVAAGVGGPITGMGGHLLLIDDPIKNREDADSETIRESVWDWYTSTAYTRLEQGGAVILILTRWHADDLAGRLLREQEHGGDQWDVLNLPALAEGDDVLGRSEGVALWPEKYDTGALARIKRVIGSRDWLALYQQRPSSAEGGLIKRDWWRYYRPGALPAITRKVQFWDTAFKAKTSNDWSVCATWAETERGYYLLDLWRGRVEFPELRRVAIQVSAKHDYPLSVIEDAASGQSLLQELRRETRIPVAAWKPDQDKVARVNAVSPFIEGGRVYLPEDAPWVADFIDEHSTFPTGTHDDQVDTTSMALTYLAQQARWEPLL